MHVNSGSIPPDGFHYPVAEGIVLRAASLDGLYVDIAEYRLRHGLPPGDPAADVDQFVCSQWPRACSPSPTEGAPPAQKRTPLQVRVATWAAMMVRDQPKGGFMLVSQAEANRRAEKCILCPFNKPWVSCAACVRSTTAVLITLRRLRGIDHADQLMACQCGGWDNATVHHFELDAIAGRASVNANLPQCCPLK